MEKRLYKSRKNKILAGVCGGIAEYIHLDPTIVRLIALLLIMAYGSGLIVYIVCAIIMPENPDEQ